MQHYYRGQIIKVTYIVCRRRELERGEREGSKKNISQGEEAEGKKVETITTIPRPPIKHSQHITTRTHRQEKEKKRSECV